MPKAKQPTLKEALSSAWPDRKPKRAPVSGLAEFDEEVAPAPQAPPLFQAPAAPQIAPLTETPSPVPVAPPTQEVAPPRQAPAGFTMVTHEVSDDLLPTLDVYSQTVLQRLLRLTWGRQVDTCTVGLPKLSEKCNISKSQARRAARILAQRGLVEIVGHDLEAKDQEMRGTTYRILLQRAPTRQRGATYGAGATRQAPNKKEEDKQINKQGALSRSCDRCKESPGFYYPDGPSGGVKKCDHGEGKPA